MIISRRTALVGLAASCAMTAGGCGGGKKPPRPAEPPPTARAEDSPSALAAAIEPARFTSDGRVLVGDTYIPAGVPVAGLVYIDGSGQGRRAKEVATTLSIDGFAVLTFVDRDAHPPGEEVLDDFSAVSLGKAAADAKTAVDQLAAHPRLQGRPIGLFGSGGRAGWIVPAAASADPRVKIMVLWNAPVCRVSDALEFGLTGASERSAAVATRFIQQIRNDGTDSDSRDALRMLDIPGLWVFGGKDPTTPIKLSMEQLDKLPGRHFEHELVPEAGEGMDGGFAAAYAVTRAWLRDELRRLGR